MCLQYCWHVAASSTCHVANSPILCQPTAVPTLQLIPTALRHPAQSPRIHTSPEIPSMASASACGAKPVDLPAGKAAADSPAPELSLVAALTAHVFHSNTCAVQVYTGCAGAATRASRDVSAEQPVAEIDYEDMVSEHLAETSLYGQAILRYLQAHSPDQLPVVTPRALLYVYCIGVAHQSSARHGLYVRSCPLWMDDPLHATGLDSVFAHGNIGPAVASRRAWLASTWRAIRPALAAHADLFPANIFTWEAYTWAHSMFVSRAFPHRLSTPLGQAQPMPLGSPARLYQGTLLPGLDLLNHAPSVPIAWTQTSTGLQFSSSVPLKQGAEVFNNYGPLPNEELLLSYGFVLESNPHDSVLLHIGVRAEDPHREQRAAWLTKAGLGSLGHVTATGDPSSELLAALRVCTGEAETVRRISASCDAAGAAAGTADAAQPPQGHDAAGSAQQASLVHEDVASALKAVEASALPLRSVLPEEAPCPAMAERMRQPLRAPEEARMLHSLMRMLQGKLKGALAAVGAAKDTVRATRKRARSAAAGPELAATADPPTLHTARGSNTLSPAPAGELRAETCGKLWPVYDIEPMPWTHERKTPASRVQARAASALLYAKQQAKMLKSALQRVGALLEACDLAWASQLSCGSQPASAPAHLAPLALAALEGVHCQLGTAGSAPAWEWRTLREVQAGVPMCLLSMPAALCIGAHSAAHLTPDLAAAITRSGIALDPLQTLALMCACMASAPEAALFKKFAGALAAVAHTNSSTGDFGSPDVALAPACAASGAHCRQEARELMDGVVRPLRRTLPGDHALHKVTLRHMAVGISLAVLASVDTPVGPVLLPVAPVPLATPAQFFDSGAPSERNLLAATLQSNASDMTLELVAQAAQPVPAGTAVALCPPLQLSISQATLQPWLA